MKTQRMRRAWTLAIFFILSIFLAPAAYSQKFPGPGLMPLDSWSFIDHSNWTDDYGDLPISFANISWVQLGDGSSLVVETNVPAWLNYEIYQTDVSATNIIVNGPGSITFWFGPGWATTNGGLGHWSQLVDIGEQNSSLGYFGLSIDPPGSNVWFFSQDGLGNTYSLSTPILWTTNYFHMIGLTYSSTNVSLYIDGQLATNDPDGLSIWPGPAVVPGGLYFGSDTNGNYLAYGLFNWAQTFDHVLDSNAVAGIYSQQASYYELSPWNIPYMSALSSATSNPSYSGTYEAVTGQGSLILLSNVDDCADATVDDVWITNVTASVVRSGTNVSMNIAFTVEGGESGSEYDVFANSVLHGGTNGAPWAWMGQGTPCNRYMLTNMPPTHCFIILGTPSAHQGNGLTDAYELLVLQISPNGPQYDIYGVPYAWYAQHGLGGNSATQDPDMDALVNYREYLFGSNPQVSEGFAIWVSTPNGTSIP